MLNVSRALLFAAAAWLVPLASCSKEPSQAEACTAFAQASCDALQRCSPDAFTRTFVDSATCLSRQQLSCSYQFPGNSNTTTQAFIDCSTATTAASCSQLVTNGSVVLTNLSQCRPAAGSQDNGSLCYADSQCKSTYCDRGLLGGLCGSCAQRALANEDCTATTCDFGLICASQGAVPPRCTAPASASLGQACDQTARCQAGLVCVQQKCATILKAGDVCTPGGGGGGGGNAAACDSSLGLYCDGTTMKCTAPTYVKAGGACGGAVPNVRTVCTGGSKCINDTACLGPAGDGQTTAYNCLPPAFAVNNICTLPDPGLCK
jgi:hypothetical protein